MTIETFPTTVSDEDGVRWWASADVHSVNGGKTYSLFTGKMFPCPPSHHMGGQKAVIKTLALRKGTQQDCESYVRRSTEAKDLAKYFYATISPPERIVFINAHISTIDEISSVLPTAVIAKRLKRMPVENECIVFEPYISSSMKHFDQENCSNTTSNVDIHRTLETFSHFTYWKSQEQLVVCDFRGINNDGVYKLTCPTIHSRQQTFGDTDKCEFGIQSFFSQHTCTSICQSWPRFQQNELPSYDEVVACAAAQQVQQPTHDSEVNSMFENTNLPLGVRVEPNAPILEITDSSLTEANPVFREAGSAHREQPPSYSDVRSHDKERGKALNNVGQTTDESPPPYTEFAEPLAPLSQHNKHKYCQTALHTPNKIRKNSTDHRITTQISCNF